jgi:ketosteroid isomerase-like protein
VALRHAFSPILPNFQGDMCMSAENDINKLLARYERAIHDKNAAAVIACYSDNAVAYDLAPPLALGARSLSDPAGLQQWFATWDTPINSVAQDIHVCADDKLAYAFALRHMTGRKKSGENVDLWFRATATMSKEHEGWKITHVHNSVPFAMDGSGKAELNLKP